MNGFLVEVDFNLNGFEMITEFVSLFNEAIFYQNSKYYHFSHTLSFPSMPLLFGLLIRLRIL